MKETKLGQAGLILVVYNMLCSLYG